MQLTPRSQLALPFPVMPFPVNNRRMSGNHDSADGESVNALTRTSESRRGTFDAKPGSKRTSAQGATRALKPQTPAEAAQKLRNKALRLLTTREHSREELLRKLAQAKARHAKLNATAITGDAEHDTARDAVHGTARDAADATKDDLESLVDQLATQGWQSDDRYAEALVRRLTGQASKRFIAEKLAQAGIKKDIAQLAIETIDVDDRDVALALWTRRFGDVPGDDKARQRQIRFLLSRGFHLSDAFKIVPRASSAPNYENERPSKWSRN